MGRNVQNSPSSISHQLIIFFHPISKYTYARFRGKPISRRVFISEDIILYQQVKYHNLFGNTCGISQALVILYSIKGYQAGRQPSQDTGIQFETHPQSSHVLLLMRGYLWGAVRSPPLTMFRYTQTRNSRTNVTQLFQRKQEHIPHFRDVHSLFQT